MAGSIAGDQPKTTYTDTTPHMRSVADLIDIIDPRQVPIVKYFGLDGSPGKFRIVNWPSYKVEWLEDTLAPLTGELAASCTKTTVEVNVTDASKYKIGDIIEIDLEMMWVSAADTTTNTLTVTRNYGGTQTSHASAVAVTIIGNARLEGADADYGRGVTDIVAPYNYTQIFQDDIKVTRTQNKITQYGIRQEFDYQTAKIMPSLLRLIDKSFYRGQRKSGSATTPRAFGGVETYVTLNTLSAGSSALTRKLMEDLIEDCWGNGGTPDLLICNSWVKRKISGFYEGFVRTTIDEKRGGVTIDKVQTEFGELDVLMDRWCPSAKLYVCESQYIGFLPFDPFMEEMMAKTGDSVKGQVVGEYTLVVKNGPAHGILKSISTTA